MKKEKKIILAYLLVSSVILCFAGFNLFAVNASSQSISIRANEFLSSPLPDQSMQDAYGANLLKESLKDSRKIITDFTKYTGVVSHIFKEAASTMIFFGLCQLWVLYVIFRDPGSRINR